MNIDLVKSLFNYREGNLYWKKSPSSRAIVGNMAGSKTKTGYTLVGVNSKLYYLHRLVWLYHNGYLPGEIDHINQIKTDNNIENLREVTRTENSRNKSPSSRSKTGFSGVHWSKKARKWSVTYMVDGTNTRAGYYGTLEEAISAKLFANSEYAYHENHR